MNRNPKETKINAELTLVIVCKLLFIFCLWYFFFSPEHRMEVTPEIVGDAFFSDTPTTSASQ